MMHEIVRGNRHLPFLNFYHLLLRKSNHYPVSKLLFPLYNHCKKKSCIFNNILLNINKSMLPNGGDPTFEI